MQAGPALSLLRPWCGHVLTASQGSGISVEFGSGFAKGKIEEGLVSPDG